MIWEQAPRTQNVVISIRYNLFILYFFAFYYYSFSYFSFSSLNSMSLYIGFTEPILSGVKMQWTPFILLLSKSSLKSVGLLSSSSLNRPMPLKSTIWPSLRCPAIASPSSQITARTSERFSVEPVSISLAILRVSMIWGWMALATHLPLLAARDLVLLITWYIISPRPPSGL